MASDSPQPVTRLDVEGTHNFREVAPGMLREGWLYRSDALHRLRRSGRATLAELGIRRIVDLRSRLDRRISGSDRLRGVPAEYISIPISGVSRTTDPATLTLRTVYRTILDEDGPGLGRAIRAIADAPGPTVVHCTAGKDRTGLVIALTLLALRVDADVVTADFASSGANLTGEWADRMARKARRFRVILTDDLREVMAGSPVAALRGALDHLDAEHGGVDRYLAGIGLDAAVIARLHATLDRR